MTAQEILAEIRNLGGRLEARGDRLHVEAPLGKVTPELKTRLALHKVELMNLLQDGSGLEDSVKRLEAANMSVAITDDGTARVLQSDDSLNDGETRYEPREMWLYISLTQRERRMLHTFKRMFGGTAEWNQTP